MFPGRPLDKQPGRIQFAGRCMWQWEWVQLHIPIGLPDRLGQSQQPYTQFNYKERENKCTMNISENEIWTIIA